MYRNEEKRQEKQLISEERKGGFKCCHCSQWVLFSEFIGTAHRNHCPFCLWSKHVDLEKSGDRKSKCKAEMKPIGLMFKQEGMDKYGKQKQGELMLIHECTQCGKISINRIAGDDSPEAILGVFEESKKINPEKNKQLKQDDIRLLTEEDKEEIFIQLFGKSFKKT